MSNGSTVERSGPTTGGELDFSSLQAPSLDNTPELGSANFHFDRAAVPEGDASKYSLDRFVKVGLSSHSPLSVSFSEPATAVDTKKNTAAGADANGSGSTVSRGVTQEARADLLQEIRSAARVQARADFNRDPSDAPDMEAVQKRIAHVCAKAGIPLDATLQRKIQNEFETAYETRHTELYGSELNWAQRRYYDVKGFATAAWSGLSTAVAGIASGINNATKAASAVIAVGAELAAEAGQAVGGAIKKGYEIATGRETYAAIGSALADAGRFIANVGSKVYELATDPETWKSIGNGLVSAWNTVTDWRAGLAAIGDAAAGIREFATSAETWQAIGSGLSSAASAVGTFAWNVASDPGKAWEQIKGAGSAVGSFLYDVGEAVGINSLGRGIWNLGYGQVELIGNTLATLHSLGSDTLGVITGKITAEELKENLKKNILNTASAFGERMSNAVEGLKGAVLLAGEITGITDVVMMAKHGVQFVSAWAKGDRAAMTEHGLMFAVHAAGAAMSIGAITATVATAGAASGTIAAALAGRATLKVAAQSILKTAAKNFMQETATSIGKEVVEQMSTTMTREVMEATSREIADTGATRLAERVAQEGSEALTEATFDVMREASAELTEKMLRESNLPELVEQATFELLENIQNKSVRQLTRDLEARGIADSRQLARQLKGLMKSGKGDAEIKQILEDGITKEVTAHLEKHMEQPFKQQFRSSLDGTLRESLEASRREMLEKIEAGTLKGTRAVRSELDAIGKNIDDLKKLENAAKEEAERLGKDLDAYIDEVVEEGWQGCRKGIDDAARKLVREGIENAFRRFRSRRHAPDLESSKAKSEVGEEGQVASPEGPALARREDSLEVAETVRDGNKTQVVSETEVLADGSTRITHRLFNDDTGRWEVLGVETTQPAAAARAAEQDTLAQDREHGVLSLTPVQKEEYGSRVSAVAEELQAQDPAVRPATLPEYESRVQAMAQAAIEDASLIGASRNLTRLSPEERARYAERVRRVMESISLTQAA